MFMKFFPKAKIVLALSLGLSLQSLSAAEVVGKVVALNGNPSATRMLKKVPLLLGDEVQEGDSLKTGDEDSVTVQLNSGHRMFVLPSTSMRLKTAQAKSTEVEQDTGSLWFKVKPLHKDEIFFVHTPTAVAGVRGTKFITMVLDPQTTDLCVCEGTVEITSGNTTLAVPQGRGTLAKLDTAPSAIKDNRNFVFQRRNLSRKPACMNCHWAGAGDTSRLDENSNIIFKAKPKK